MGNRKGIRQDFHTDRFAARRVLTGLQLGPCCGEHW